MELWSIAPAKSRATISCGDWHSSERQPHVGLLLRDAARASLRGSSKHDLVKAASCLMVAAATGLNRQDYTGVILRLLGTMLLVRAIYRQQGSRLL